MLPTDWVNEFLLLNFLPQLDFLGLFGRDPGCGLAGECGVGGCGTRHVKRALAQDVRRFTLVA